MVEPAQRHWSQIPERKGTGGIKVILLFYRLFGRRVAHWVMLPVVGCFWLSGKKQRQASKTYLTQLKKYTQQSGISIPWVAEHRLNSWHHFLRFGDALLDKLACWQGDIRLSDIYSPAQTQISELIKQKQGTLLIGSHLGDIELCRALAELSEQVTINALVFTTHAKHFNQLLQSINPIAAVHLIQIDQIGVDTAIILKQKIERGEWIAIVGDRTSSHLNLRKHAESVVWCDFLGRSAPFPTGPFILASLMACPVYLFWGLKPNGRWQFYFEPFAKQIVLPRQTRQLALQDYITQYSQRLQHYCLISPLDWFNFFDFWQLSYPTEPTPKSPIYHQQRGDNDEK